MDNLIPLFLQKILGEQILESDRLSELYQYYCERCGIDTHDLPLSKLIDKINAKLLPLDLELRSSIDQDLDLKVYILINLSHSNSSHKINQFKNYTQLEFQYLMVVVETIINSGIKKLYVTMEDATKLKVTYDATTNMVEDEEVNITTLKGNFPASRRDSQLLFDRCNGLVLGPRILTELQLQLNERYPEILKFCARCSNLVTKGFCCNLCAKPFHTLCLQPYLKEGSSELSGVDRCPHCLTVWKPTTIGNVGIDSDNGSWYSSQPDNEVGNDSDEVSQNTNGNTQFNESEAGSSPRIVVKTQEEESFI